MKRNLLTVLTALALCLSLCPTWALAADLPGLLIQDTMVTAGNMDDVLGDGTVSTTYENGKWTIRLTNASLTGPISVNHTSDNSTVDADIILSGKNTVTINRDFASGISASASLTIRGDGSLTVTSTGAEATGIGVAGSLVISGAEVSAHAQYTAIYGDTVKIQESRVTALSSAGLGLLGTNGLEISGSTVSAVSTSSLAVASYGNIVISDSEVEASSNASMGINTPADVEISGQSVVTGTNSSYSLCAMGSVFISGGKVDMTSRDQITIYAAKQLSITEGADVTAKGGQGCLVVGAIGSVTGGGTLLVDGAALHTTASVGPGVMVDGEAVIQRGADVTAISGEHLNSSYPGYGLLALALTVDGSNVSASSGALDGIYVGTRENPAGGDMTVKGDSGVTAAGKNCGITVEGTFSIEEGSVTSRSTADHGINVGGTLLILKGSVDAASEEYRGVNVGKLLDIRNGAAFHAKGGSYMASTEDAVAVISADGIQLGSLCAEETGGVPGAAKITQGGIPKDITVFVDENGRRLQEVTITTDSADYTEVNAAIAQIPGDLSVYTSESVAALNSAKNAVNWELPSAQQDTVDGYAAAIEAAIAGLVRRPYTPPSGHTHAWAENWTASETHHWHECTASGCPVTANSGKNGYGEHVYDGGAVCGVCGWRRSAAPSGSSGGGGSGSHDTFAVTVVKPEHGNVTSSHAYAGIGSTVTLTAAPDPGRALDTLSVTDNRGRVVKLTDRGGGKYAFTMPGGSVTVRAVFTAPEETDCPSRAFSDLDTGAWYHEAVDHALRNGLMGGYGNGLFGPDNVLTRAQFAQILYNREGRPAVTGGEAFTDVPSGAWYADAVAWAAARGIVSGYGGGRFGPSDPITREQLAVMLWRYAGSPAAGGEPPFRDAGEIGAHARNAVSWAVESGVMSGRGGGILDPKGYATRAQAAQMLRNFLENG